jgi:hypothetical protein
MSPPSLASSKAIFYCQSVFNRSIMSSSPPSSFWTPESRNHSTHQWCPPLRFSVETHYLSKARYHTYMALLPSLSGENISTKILSWNDACSKLRLENCLQWSDVCCDPTKLFKNRAMFQKRSLAVLWLRARSRALKPTHNCLLHEFYKTTSIPIHVSKTRLGLVHWCTLSLALVSLLAKRSHVPGICVGKFVAASLYKNEKAREICV